MPIKKSKYEDKIASNAKRDKAKLSYETQKFEYDVPYEYTIDWVLVTKSGHKIFLESKGGNSYRFFDSAGRKRWKHFYLKYKDRYDIRLICEKDFKIGKVLTISGWAAKLGVKIHIGDRIPKEWINE